MYKLHQKYQNSDEIYIGACGNYLPLPTNGIYPVFNHYPVDTVNYCTKIRDQKIDEVEQFNKKEAELSELRNRVSKLLIQDKLQREQSEVISKNLASKANQEKHNLEIEILHKMKDHDERTEYLKQMEQTLKQSIDSFNVQRQNEKQRLHNEYEERQRLADYQHKTQQQEQAIRNMEHQATQRVLEMISIREKEENARQLDFEANQRLKIEEARDKAMMEKWRLEDDERKLKSEMLLREKQKEREIQVFEHDRRRVEMQHRLHQLEKDVYVMQLERERKLRQTQEEYAVSVHNMQVELRKKNEVLRQEEQRQARMIMEKEKNNLNQYNYEKIEKEKQEIDKAIEFERQEQERLIRAAEKKRFEEEIMNVKLSQQMNLNEENKQIEKMKNMMENEKKDREAMNGHLYHREKEIVEKEKFYDLLASTEENIRKQEQEKHQQVTDKLKKSVEEALMKSKEDRENKLREIVREREKNFQEYAYQRHEQISQEYRNYYDDQKQHLENVQNMIKSNAENENTSPNRLYKSVSDLSCSMNQKYINKDKYASKEMDTSQDIENRNILNQSYPVKPDESVVQDKSPLHDSMYEGSDSFSHADDDEKAIRDHELVKHKFESYKQQQFAQDNVVKSFDYARESNNYGPSAMGSMSELPVKDNTFGANRSSQEYGQYRVTSSMPYTNFEGQNINARFENQDVRSQFAARVSKFSNFSSPITEEEEGESCISSSDESISMNSKTSQEVSYVQQQNMGYAQRQHMGYSQQQHMGYAQQQNIGYAQQENMGYAQNYQASYPQQTYMNYMYAQSPSQLSYQIENESEVSSSEESELPDRSKYPHNVNDMSINPFYKPNQGSMESRQWKRVE